MVGLVMQILQRNLCELVKALVVFLNQLHIFALEELEKHLLEFQNCQQQLEAKFSHVFISRHHLCFLNKSLCYRLEYLALLRLLSLVQIVSCRYLLVKTFH